MLYFSLILSFAIYRWLHFIGYNIGNAEWEDATKTSVRIYWRSPDVLSDELYDWVTKNCLINDVLTIYELHSGDEHPDCGEYELVCNNSNSKWIYNMKNIFFCVF